MINFNSLIHPGLRAKMLFYFGIGVTTLLFLTGLIMLYGLPALGVRGEYEIRRMEVLQNFNTFADLKKTEISRWFEERRNDVRIIVESNLFISRAAGLQNELAQYRLNGLNEAMILQGIRKTGNYQEISSRVKRIQRVHREYESIRIADAGTGIVIVSTDDSDVGEKISAGLLRKIIERGGAAEWIFFDTEHGSDKSYLYIIHFVKTSGLRAGSGKSGPVFLIFKIDHENFLRPMLHTGEGLGRSGEVVLVNMDRTILYPLKYPLPDGSWAAPMKYRLTTKPAELAAMGIDGIVFSDDYRGRQVIAVIRHARITSELGLGMVMKYDESEIFEPLRKSFMLAAAVSLTGLTILLGFIYIISGRLSYPIERLSSTARRVEKGDFSARADFTNGDEVGILAKSFNAMMERIQNWHKELDSVVEVRTSQLREINQELEAEIARRSRSEEALQHAKAYAENLIETANAMIICLNTSGNIIVFNKAAEEITGFTGKDLQGKNWFEMLVPLKARPDVWAEFRRLLAGGIPQTFENHILTRDGEERLISWQNNLVSEGGRVMGTISFGIDVTDYRKAERDREKLEEQLRQAQKLEAIGTLAGGVAHDFNNILSAIIGYGHLTLMKMGVDDPAKHNIEQILESSQRAAVLTQSLLAFSRKQPVNLMPVELNGLIRRFEQFILRLIREDIELRTLCADEELFIMADTGQIEQVIMNLVTNALDAMPSGGKLTIEIKRSKLDEAFTTVHGFGAPGDYALVLVTDTGSGMDENTRTRIFEPFFTTKEVGKGTGLGLAMVYGIVKKHEGFINVYSEPGAGTSFKIYLPVIKPEAVEELKEPEIAAVKGGTETILVAEDDAMLRRLSTTLLGEFGYTVIEAVDGKDAIRKFLENKDRIHLVLLDGIMPGKNGKEAYDEMKRLRPDIKAIFMSGYAEDVFTRNGVLQKDVTFILKPISPHVLLKKIRDELDVQG